MEKRKIRIAALQDAEALLAIYRPYVEQTAITFEYEVPTLEELLKRQGILNLNACIAYPEAEDAHLTKDSVFFHKKMGYREVGIFHQCGYKFDRWYHMIWMEKAIGEHEAFPMPVKPFPEIKKQLCQEKILDRENAFVYDKQGDCSGKDFRADIII